MNDIAEDPERHRRERERHPSPPDGTLVWHPRWGRGVVVAADLEVVHFEEHGNLWVLPETLSLVGALS